MDVPILGPILRWLQALFFSKHLQIAILGLQSAGKTSLVNVISSGQFSEEMVPTVGFNMRKIQSGNVQIKMWDIGGQPRFRSMWERYCRGVSAIVFVVDSAIPRPSTEQQPASATSTAVETAPDPSADKQSRAAALTTAAGTGSASSRLANIAWHTATEELHALVSRPELAGIPLLVLATKNDVKGAASVEEVIKVMKLDTLRAREVSCYSVSSKTQSNIPRTMQWLCNRQPLGTGK
ncbi:P-loop containing nucleoside triphosphate hydrolase protein [Microstroma glucosiphilum]|uniref:P-loop containing nucleoside triphosphate hydrolase protein n=1 Tax=Pseudomicrostroma glucosiphilum TaxID=1684307 RepID=A0A316UC39_9BASI|nr:P-loop containing nucleoside triphosphate hydrolase protein [Pseudomicrostroma glucosiphilum]PWN22739.1 P-loop containing nucleoside triphosphate hydrolase protein [Pseudomicrostroma glucosiphilum]